MVGFFKIVKRYMTSEEKEDFRRGLCLGLIIGFYIGAIIEFLIIRKLGL